MGSDEPRIAVTGAAGFVGLNVVERLLTAGVETVAVDVAELPAVAKSDFARLPGSLREVVARITDPVAIATAMTGVDVVIHGAAITPDADRERREARRVVEVNIMGTQTVLDAVGATGTVRRLVYVSSGAVYGNRAFGSIPVDETTPPEPVSLYSITKLAGERLVGRHAEMHGLEVVVARLSAVFGPWERDTGARDSISPMYRLARAKRSGGPAVFGAYPLRNWLYSRDAAVALCGLALAPHLDHDLYNVSPTEWCQPLGWARHLGLELGADDSDAQEFGGGLGAANERRDPRAPVANDRIRSAVSGWPAHGPDEAFRDYASWLETHRDFE